MGCLSLFVLRVTGQSLGCTDRRASLACFQGRWRKSSCATQCTCASIRSGTPNCSSNEPTTVGKHKDSEKTTDSSIKHAAAIMTALFICIVIGCWPSSRRLLLPESKNGQAGTKKCLNIEMGETCTLPRIIRNRALTK
jgi:hypothetical protein